MEKINKNEFKKLQELGDLIALIYLEKRIPKKFKKEYELVLELNYINSLVEQGDLNIDNFYNVYAEKRDNLFKKLNIL